MFYLAQNLLCVWCEGVFVEAVVQVKTKDGVVVDKDKANAKLTHARHTCAKSFAKGTPALGVRCGAVMRWVVRVFRDLAYCAVCRGYRTPTYPPGDIAEV